MKAKVKFTNGERRHKKDPTHFHIPSKDEKRALKVGYWVKVGLENFPREIPCSGERFWVELTSISGSKLTGKIVDVLFWVGVHGVDKGDTLSFEKKHVLDIDTDPDPDFVDVISLVCARCGGKRDEAA
jgi:hypothetical protein